MKILILNTYYYPNVIGGTEVSLKLLAERLVKKGHSVQVFTADGIKNLSQSVNGIKVKRFKGILYKNKLNRLLYRFLDCYNPLILKNLYNLIVNFKPDIMYTNNLFYLSPFVWKIAKYKFDIPIVHTIRDIWLWCPKSKLASTDNRKCNNILCSSFRSYIKFLSRYVDYVTAPSKAIMDFFVGKGYFKNAFKDVIPNAVDVDRKAVEETIDLRVKKPPDRSLKFLYMGRLSETKGVRLLINAFKKLPEKNVELIICGDGELKEFVMKSTEQDKRIKYLGAVFDNEKEKVYKMCDVLVFPSLSFEAFGRVVIEAYQFGLPVIATNFGGTKEIVLDNQTGILINTLSEDSLILAIKKMMDEDFRRRLIGNIYPFVLNFSLDEQIKRFESVFETAIWFHHSL